jgi:hypothetical protein
MDLKPHQGERRTRERGQVHSAIINKERRDRALAVVMTVDKGRDSSRL